MFVDWKCSSCETVHTSDCDLQIPHNVHQNTCGVPNKQKESERGPGMSLSSPAPAPASAQHNEAIDSISSTGVWGY